MLSCRLRFVFSLGLVGFLTLGSWSKVSAQQSNLTPNEFTPLIEESGSFDDLNVDRRAGFPLVRGQFNNIANLIDDNISNTSTYAAIVDLGGTVWVEVKDNKATGQEVFQGGSYAGFVVDDNSALNLLSGLKITTYLGDQKQEFAEDSGLLSLGILSGKSRVGFYTTKDFDRIRLTVTGLGLGTSVSAYHAEVMKFAAADALVCNTPTVMVRPDFPVRADTSTTGGGSVTGADNALYAGTSNSAALNVAVAGSATLSIKDEISSYPANTYVGFDIENTSLLSLELLGNMTIRTYFEGNPTGDEFSGGTQLAALDLLNSSRTRVGFVTTKKFDEVEIEISSAGLNLGSTLVYNAVIQCFEMGPDLPTCNVPTKLTAPDYPVYISERTGISGLLDANSKIVNAQHVLDGNNSNYAELDFLATVTSEISLGVKDQITDYPAGTFVGFDIENSANILNLELLNSIKITSYLNNTEQESVSGSSLLLGADLVSGSDRRTVGFVTGTAVDEVVITLDGDLAGVNLGTTRVYNALFQCFEAGPELANCNNYTRPTTPDYPLTISQTGITGAGCVSCDIQNTNNVIDADLDNYATMNFTAAVGATMTLGVKDQITDYPAGTFAGFDIENTASLLDLQLLNSISISTYLNGSPAETIAAGNLSLGATLLNGSDRKTVGFVTTEPFDEVVLTINGGLASIPLGITRVYGLVLKCFAEGPALECNTNTYLDESTYPIYIDMANTGVAGTLGANNEISGLSNMLDNNPATYTTITQTAGVGNTATIAVKKALDPIPAETYVAFDIENPNLLGVDLFKGVSVSLYLNGTQVETVSSDELISISSSILNGTGRQKVGFISSGSFDEARLVLDPGLVGVDVGTTRVYGLVLQEFCEGPELDCKELSILYGGSSGHPVIVNGQRTGVDALACAGCEINNPDNAIDNDPNTAATISLTVGAAASATFSVLNAIETYSAGNFAGFDIGTPSLLDVDLLDDFIITTYLDGELQEQKNIPSSLISATTDLLANDGREVVGFVTSEDFDEIQITLSKLVSANVSNFNIYSTIVQRGCEKVLECGGAKQWLTPEFPLVVEGPHTGIDGAVSVGAAVLNPWNLINQNTSDFARLVAPVGVLSPASISIRDQVSEYPTGTTVGFTVRSVNNISQADLLESITITTYKEGALVESATGVNLINLDLIVPLLGTGGLPYNVGFVTSAPFDEIQISLGGLANAINILDVYSPFVDKSTAVDGSGNPLCPQISMDPDFNVTTINVEVNGDVNTNDGVPSGTNYGTPVASGNNPGTPTTFTMNTNGTYTFEASIPGIYEYDVPVCVPGEPTPCPTTRLSITVMDNTDPTSNPPVANTDYGTVHSNGSIELATLANDSPGYPEASLVPGSVTITSGLSNGTASVDAGTGNITYTPSTGFIGKDSLTYEVCDDSNPALCGTAWQYFTVIPDGSPNSTTATDDFIYLKPGEVGSGNLGENDTDPEGDTQSITTGSIMQSGVGTLEITNSSGDFTFTPAANFSGPGQFTYTTCDDGNPQACASATLYVLVDQPKPDLTPGIQVNISAINEGGSANITYNFSNLGPAVTDGSTVEFIIFKANSFGTLSMGSSPSGWTITDQGSYYSLTSNNVISVGLQNRVIFTATFQHDNDNEDAVINFRTAIINGSGGETNYSNNTDEDPVQVN